MNGYLQLLNKRNFHLVRRSLVAGLVLIIACAGAYGFAHLTRSNALAAQSASSAQVDALRNELAELTATQDELSSNLQRFRQLAESGFVGPGDRISWTEALLQVQRELQLPELSFELAAQKPILSAAEIEALQFEDESDSAGEYGALAHDMKVEMIGVHEGELLALFEALRAKKVGHFRVQSCDIERNTSIAGLEVSCVLRWISFLPSPQDDMASDPEAIQ